MTRRPWSDEEVALLKAFYESRKTKRMGLAAFAASLGRTETRVCAKAKLLGLTNLSYRDQSLRRSSNTGEVLPPRKYTDEEFREWKAATARERMIARWNSPEYRARQKAITDQPEVKERRSRTAQERIRQYGHNRGAAGLKHTEEAKAKMKAALKRYHESASKEQIDARLAKALSTKVERYGSGNPSARGKNAYSRCKGGTRTDLGLYVRSAWEANFCRYLNLLVNRGEIRSWEYEPRTFIFHGETKGAVSYTPDFLVHEIDGGELFYEVKGWMTSKSRTRLARMKKHYPDVRVELVGETQYRSLSQIAPFIANWEY